MCLSFNSSLCKLNLQRHDEKFFFADCENKVGKFFCVLSKPRALMCWFFGTGYRGLVYEKKEMVKAIFIKNLLNLKGYV